MKPLKKVTDLKENEVIHCKTEKEAKAICQLMHDAGYGWINGYSFINNTNFEVFKDQTYYNMYEGTICSHEHIKDMKYTIHPAKDFLTTKVTKKEILNRIEKLEKDFKKFDAIAKATTMVDGTLKAIQIIKESENSPLPNMENGCNVVISGKEKLFPKELEKEAEKIFSNQIPLTTSIKVSVTESEKEKVLLYIDMLEHARSVNGDWLPDWSVTSDTKLALKRENEYDIVINNYIWSNCGIFGIAYQTEKSAEQAKEKFTERILKYYGN